MKLNKLTKLTLVSLIAGLLSLQAHDDYNHDHNDGKYFSILEGLYVEGHIGVGLVDQDASAAKSSGTETEFTIGASLGYQFDLNEYLDLEDVSIGPEIGYKHFSNAKWTTAGSDYEADAHAISLLAVLMVGINEDWSIFGKIGAAYVDNDTVGIGVNPTITSPTTKDHTAWNLELAAGVGYMLTEQFEVVGMIDHIFDEKDETPSLTTIGAGLRIWL